MNREALVERNRLLAQAYHAQPMRHRLRARLLQLAASFPFTPHTSPTERILLIRPDHIGDMLLAIPAIHALKHARPQAEIHVLAGPWAAPVLETLPEITQVLTIRFPGFERVQDRQQPLQPYQMLLRVSRQLRSIGYTSAVILRPDHWWGALLAHAAGIRDRVGYDHAEVMPFLTHSVPFQEVHAVRQNLRLVERWTGVIADEDVRYDLPVHDFDAEFADEWLRSQGWTPERPLVCIHPGAGTWVKQWEAPRWSQTADALHEHFDSQILITGTMAESQLVNQIVQQAQHPVMNATGVLSLGQLAAVYARAQVVVGCDSGPLHLAAAVHTPTVALFGPANPAEFGQWGDRQRHLLLMSGIGCRPCRVLDWGDDPPENHPCLRDISVHEVLGAVRRLLVDQSLA